MLRSHGWSAQQSTWGRLYGHKRDESGWLLLRCKPTHAFQRYLLQSFLARRRIPLLNNMHCIVRLIEEWYEAFERSFLHRPYFPKQVYLWGSILGKKRLDTLVGALCYVGRGFGCAGRAGLGWAWGLGWVGRRFGFLCMARWAGLGGDLAVLGVPGGWAWGLALVGGLGWVGRGFGFLCMVYIVHVFFMSSWCLCVYVHVNLRCVSWGLSKTKPGIGEWNVVLSNSVFQKWSERNGSKRRETAVAATNTV